MYKPITINSHNSTKEEEVAKEVKGDIMEEGEVPIETMQTIVITVETQSTININLRIC